MKKTYKFSFIDPDNEKREEEIKAQNKQIALDNFIDNISCKKLINIESLKSHENI